MRRLQKEERRRRAKDSAHVSNIRLGREGALTFADLLPKLLKNASVFQEQNCRKIAPAPEAEEFENDFETKRDLKEGEHSPLDFNEFQYTNTQMNLVPDLNIKILKSKTENSCTNLGDEKQEDSNPSCNNINTPRDQIFNNEKSKETDDFENNSKFMSNYKVVKELTNGDYFGEISLLTNLPVTCSIHSISNMIVSTIQREDMIKFLDDFQTCKIKIQDKMYEYNDSYFQSLHRLIESIPCLRQLSFETIRSIALKLRKKIVRQNTVIINLKEINSKTYFLYSGKVRISVFDPKTKMLFPFQYLNDGSCFNFTNSLLEYESIFCIEAISTCTLYILEEKDLQQAACDDFILK